MSNLIHLVYKHECDPNSVLAEKITIVIFSLSPFFYLIFEELVRLSAELLLTPSSADHPCLDSLSAFSFPSKLDDLVPQEGCVIQLWP